MLEIVREMRMGLAESLEQATALIGPRLREETQPLQRRIAQCREEGNYAFWMDTLFWVGACAEELNLEADLPSEFWHCLAFAAGKMQFPQFIPQAQGKAEGRSARGLCDYLAAVAVIHREVGKHWAGCFPKQPDLLDSLVANLAAVHPDYPALLVSEPAPALARRFVADGWLTDPPPERFHPVRRGLGDVFLPLFEFINASGFPEALADERWSVIAFNGFRVKLGGGLFPLTVAKPWWMK
jgi:hypothetical protein